MSSARHTPTRPRVAFWLHGDQGSPVLFIMGLGMPGLVWASQVAEIRRVHQCCTYDHLGVGRSDPAPPSLSMGSMASDALRVADAVGWERFHVVGVSLGGMIAQEVALCAEHRCASLTLIATHAGGPLASLPTAKGILYFLKTVGSKGQDRAHALERLLYPPHFIRSLDDASKRSATAARLEKPPPLDTVRKQVAAARRHRTASRLAKLTLPTLLVRPGMDILIRPAETDRLAEHIRHARVLRFDDAGHGVLFQKADELNAALLEHFRNADRLEDGPGFARSAS